MLHSKHTLREFDTHLNSIKIKLIKMGNLCELALFQTAQALHKRDLDLANKVIANDSEIDNYETTIDHKGITILACYSPVAGDLRYTLSIIRMASILERIGDECTNISKRTKKLIKLAEIPETRLVEPIFQKLSQFLTCILAAVDHQDFTHLKSKLTEVQPLRDECKRFTEKLMYLADISDSSIPELAELILISRSMEKIAHSQKKLIEEFLEMKD